MGLAVKPLDGLVHDGQAGGIRGRRHRLQPGRRRAGGPARGPLLALGLRAQVEDRLKQQGSLKQVVQGRLAEQGAGRVRVLCVASGAGRPGVPAGMRPSVPQPSASTGRTSDRARRCHRDEPLVRPEHGRADECAARKGPRGPSGGQPWAGISQRRSCHGPVNGQGEHKLHRPLPERAAPRRRLLFVGRVNHDFDFYAKGGDLVLATLALLRRDHDPRITLTVAGPENWPVPGSPPDGVPFLGSLPLAILQRFTTATTYW